MVTEVWTVWGVGRTLSGCIFCAVVFPRAMPWAVSVFAFQAISLAAGVFGHGAMPWAVSVFAFQANSLATAFFSYKRYCLSGNLAIQNIQTSVTILSI